VGRNPMLQYLHIVQIVIQRRLRRSEAGLATAELLGNAALGVAALVVIWAALQALGLDIVDWIRSQVMG
jgi:hypothetical protein